jgi:bacillithiol system protein YtxJ
MLWRKLIDSSQLEDIINISNEQHINAVLLFKHSTRCSISSMALSRLESRWKDDDAIPTYFLDLLNFRNISNEISERFSIEHASPQVLLIKNGICVYHNSHSGISATELLDAAKNTL